MTCQINVTLDVNYKCVSIYNRGIDENGRPLNTNPLDTVILMIKLLNSSKNTDEQAASKYLTISSKFKFTSFGMPRRVLCMKGKTPLNQLTYSQINELQKNNPQQGGSFIPLHLFVIIDNIYRRWMKVDSLFFRYTAVIYISFYFCIKTISICRNA